MRLRWLAPALPAGPRSASALLDRVARFVPAEADYASVGLFGLVPDAMPLVGDRPGRRGRGRVLGLPPSVPALTPGVLVLVGTRLTLLQDGHEVWSCCTWSMRSLVTARPGGFLLLNEGVDVIAGVQAAVRVPSGARWRTVPRLSRPLGGWDAELGRLGVSVYV